MKPTWSLALPLAVLSLGTVTRWWLVRTVDAPDTMLIGFPLPFAGDGWHTSVSLQIFGAELVADVLIHVLFWLAVVALLRRCRTPFKMPAGVVRAVWAAAGLVLAGLLWVAHFPENRFEARRSWPMRVLATGWKLTWTYQARPEATDPEP